MKEISRIGAYGITLFNKNVLLVRQMKGPLKDLLDLPGGGLEEGETPAVALKREFFEEVAGHFDHFTHIETLFHTHYHPTMIYHLEAHIFIVTGFAHHLNAKDNGELPFHWYPIEQLSQLPLTPIAEKSLKIVQSRI